MTVDELQSIVLNVLADISKLNGREWKDLGVDAKPIGALEEFDSLSAIEATVMIEAKLGCNLEVESLFVSDDGKRALTVKQICARLAKLLGDPKHPQ